MAPPAGDRNSRQYTRHDGGGQQSADRGFGLRLAKAARAFINSSIVHDKVSRTDVKVVYVPCDDIAKELGNPKVGNMIMLGAYVAATGVLKKETIEHMITEMFTGKKAKLVPLNMEALNRGMACITQ